MSKIGFFLNLPKFNIFLLIFSFCVLTLYIIITNYFNYSNFTNNYFKFKNIVLIIFSLSFFLFLIYFFLIMHFKHLLLVKNYIYNKYDFKYFYTSIYDSSSFIIIYLCYIVGFISILTLNDRFWKINSKLSLIFLFFIIIINLLCQSCSIFELFFYYELLLLPSIFFVYKASYTKKSQKANIYFFIWTQLGSLLVLIGILYIIVICGTTNFIFLKNFKFSNNELYILYLLFFFGFGVKVPIWPFHFWLIKVHVEAPSGFSIFLSGFLVKSAIYCFYKIIILFKINYFYIIPLCICIYGMLDSSLKMWTQIDIKKLIAYATVQEMNAIYLLFNFGDSWAINIGLIFLLAHGILSSFMFFLIECIYKRYNTRNIEKIYGILNLYPNLGLSIWGMLILFFGFPGTLKFYVELQLILLVANTDLILTFIILFVFIFINAVGFARCWFSILYGHSGYKNNKSEINMDLTIDELIIILFLFILSIIPCFFIYLL